MQVHHDVTEEQGVNTQALSSTRDWDPTELLIILNALLLNLLSPSSTIQGKPLSSESRDCTDKAIERGVWYSHRPACARLLVSGL
jgi:hypothetical protein